MRYYEYLVKLLDNDILRNFVLIMKDVRLVFFYFKKCGARKHCWINCIFYYCLAVSGMLFKLRCDINSVNWLSVVRIYVRGLAEERWYYN